MRRLVFALVLTLVGRPVPARAEPVVVIESARVSVGQLTPAVPQAFSDIDLGPAPPPGGSRLFARRDVVGLLARRGVDARSFELPPVVRIKSAAEEWSTEKIRSLATPLVAAALPDGVHLASMRPARPIVVPKGAGATNIVVPKLPNRSGSVTLTALIDVVRKDGEVFLKLPVTITVQISEAAARPDVVRGSRVHLFIDRSTARVSAIAVALEDADIGDVVSFRVQSTRKVLRGRVESTGEARVVER